MEHAGEGLAAGTAVASGVWADLDVQDVGSRAQPFMHGVDHSPIEEAPGDVGLVRDDDDLESGSAQPLDRVRCIGRDVELIKRPG